MNRAIGERSFHEFTFTEAEEKKKMQQEERKRKTKEEEQHKMDEQKASKQEEKEKDKKEDQYPLEDGLLYTDASTTSCPPKRELYACNGEVNYYVDEGTRV